MNKHTLLKQPANFEDLTKKDEIARLNRQFKDIVTNINQERELGTLPMPGNFDGTFSRTGQAALWWDDVTDDLRDEVDGARIWKAEVAVDGNMVLQENIDARQLVGCVRTTRYVDLEVESGKAYVYWVQWVRKDGEISRAAGGLTGTIT